MKCETIGCNSTKVKTCECGLILCPGCMEQHKEYGECDADEICDICDETCDPDILLQIEANAETNSVCNPCKEIVTKVLDAFGIKYSIKT